MKRPEPSGEGANNEEEITVYNKTNEELYPKLTRSCSKASARKGSATVWRHD